MHSFNVPDKSHSCFCNTSFADSFPFLPFVPDFGTFSWEPSDPAFTFCASSIISSSVNLGGLSKLRYHYFLDSSACSNTILFYFQIAFSLWWSKQIVSWYPKRYNFGLVFSIFPICSRIAKIFRTWTSLIGFHAEPPHTADRNYGREKGTGDGESCVNRDRWDDCRSGYIKHLSLHIRSEPVSLHPIDRELILSEKTLLTCPSALHPNTCLSWNALWIYFQFPAR